jgi:hypothetical protein
LCVVERVGRISGGATPRGRASGDGPLAAPGATQMIRQSVQMPIEHSLM